MCKTVTGEVTISTGVTAISSTVVHSSMLNADVFSIAHSWSATQSSPNELADTDGIAGIWGRWGARCHGGGEYDTAYADAIEGASHLATSSLKGALPAWPNNTTTFFRGDGSYATLNFAALGGQATLAQFPTGGANDTALGFWGIERCVGAAIKNCSMP